MMIFYDSSYTYALGNLCPMNPFTRSLNQLLLAMFKSKSG